MVLILRNDHNLGLNINLKFQGKEKQLIEDELNADLSVKATANEKYKKAIVAAKASVGGLTMALSQCKDTLESAM